MPVLPPQSIVRPTIDQQERQRRLLQQQHQRQQLQPPSRSASKDIPTEEYDRESKEGRERLLAEYDRERAEKRDRLLRRKLDSSLKNVFNAYPQILQTMAEIDPTMTEVSITVTLTTVSQTGPDNNNTNKLSVTTAFKSTASAQYSQTGVSSSVAGPATFKNNGDSKAQTPSTTYASYDPAPLPRINPAQPTPLRHTVATGKAVAAHAVVSSSPLEDMVKRPDSEIFSATSSPAASLSSSSGPSLEGEAGILLRRSSSGAKRVRKRRTSHVDEYVLGERLGKGTFAKVHKCKSNVDQKEYVSIIVPYVAIFFCRGRSAVCYVVD